MSAKFRAEEAQYLDWFQEDSSTGARSGHREEIRTTPLCSLAAKHEVDASLEDQVLPQYGLLGFHIGNHPLIKRKEVILMNTRAPNSTFVCGSQGSGKSYTVACLLENCLLQDPALGTVKNPVAGVALHYDADDAAGLAEVASLCFRRIKVNVLLSPSKYLKLRAAYLSLPGATQYLTVEALLFTGHHLSVDRMHKMMAIDGTETAVPLYVEVMQRILRQMAVESADNAFNMTRFLRALEDENFAPGQKAMLTMRLGLLNSFLYDKAPEIIKPQGSKKVDIFQLLPGTLTVIDLSDPFLVPATVCMLFDICLGLISQNRPEDGMIITLDEAHKYLDGSPAADSFTNHLLTTIRMQRHNATRAIIATQEPTISEKLLDLCSTSIIHRFTSPAWFATIKEHLSGASSLIASPEQQKDMFNRIVNLGTGESLVFSPSSYLCTQPPILFADDEPVLGVFAEGERVGKLGTAVMKMKTRTRRGVDIGMSRLAGEVKTEGAEQVTRDVSSLALA